MKLFHKTSALSFYMIHSGFKAFKDRTQWVAATWTTFWTTTACTRTTATAIRLTTWQPPSALPAKKTEAKKVFPEQPKGIPS